MGAEVEGELEGGFVGVGEEFELVEDLLGVAEPGGGGFVDEGEEGFRGAPEDGGGDGAWGDGEDGESGCFGGVLRSAEIACAELAVYFCESEADAVAVGQGRRWMQLKLREGEVGGFEEGLELRGFESELGGVGEVL